MKMKFRKILKYSTITLVLCVLVLGIVSYAIARQWKNNATEGLSIAEGKAIVDVYKRSTTSYDSGFMGINFYTVHKDNALKMYDNVMYQTDYIDLVGDLYSFSVKDYRSDEKLFMWLNYYPFSPDYLSVKNIVEVYKAWIIAGIPMTFLSDEYEWFPIANYKETRKTGIKFPSDINTIDKDLAYQDFQKFEPGVRYKTLDSAMVNTWLNRISNEEPLENKSLYLNYFIVHKDDLASIYESSKHINDIMQRENCLLLKYSYRPHGDYCSFMWVAAVPVDYKYSGNDSLNYYQNIIEKSILFEKVVVKESVKPWPKTYESMDRFY